MDEVRQPAGALGPVRPWRLVLAVASPTIVPAALAVLAAVGLAAASFYRHEHFGSNAFDLGVIDQTIWGYSRLEPTMDNTVQGTPNLLLLHFQPILALLAPLYWIWDDPRMLLVVQAAFVALASVPLYLWARRELGLREAVLFQVAYLVFWGVLAGNIYDFHELALAAPIISLALYAVLTQRTKLLLATALLALLTKENLALTVVGLGLYVALVQRRWKLGLALAGVAAVAFAALLKLVIPAISGRAYAHWFYPALGSGPGSALVHVITHPVDTVKLLFTPRAKVTALFNLFAPWPYTWIHPLRLPDVRRVLVAALDSGYGVACTRGGTTVLRRGAQSRSLSPELRRQLAQSS